MQFVKEDFINKIKPLLKKHGFKKIRTTWHKVTDDLIFVFNVQGSQWGPEYYINLGIYLRAIGDELSPPEYKCHVRTRLEVDDVQYVLNSALKWFNLHGSIEGLKKLYFEDKLPYATFIAAKEFLKNYSVESR